MHIFQAHTHIQYLKVNQIRASFFSCISFSLSLCFIFLVLCCWFQMHKNAPTRFWFEFHDICCAHVRTNIHIHTVHRHFSINFGKNKKLIFFYFRVFLHQFFFHLWFRYVWLCLKRIRLFFQFKRWSKAKAKVMIDIRNGDVWKCLILFFSDFDRYWKKE